MSKLFYSKPILFVVCHILAASYVLNYGHAISLTKKVKVPALLVFGDSIVDPGNNNYIDTIGKANFPPYGRDFEGGLATGRYSNGKIPSDLIAEALGIKELVPPYLDPKLNINDLLTGVSFASGASGFDPLSPQLANTLSLDDQLKMFKEYINKLKAAVGENNTSYIISESVYLVSAGSNDFTNTYFGLPITTRSAQYNVTAYTSVMVSWASTFLQELYKMGARKIAMISAPPCGCLPSQRAWRGGLFRKCVQKENQASILYNYKLSKKVGSLNKKLKGSNIVYLDIYNPLLNLITNPAQSGFEVVDRGCCGTGNLEVSFMCTEISIGTCKDASKYVFWDSFHPTEASYRSIVQQIMKEIDCKMLRTKAYKKCKLI